MQRDQAVYAVFPQDKFILPYPSTILHLHGTKSLGSDVTAIWGFTMVSESASSPSARWWSMITTGMPLSLMSFTRIRHPEFLINDHDKIAFFVWQCLPLHLIKSGLVEAVGNKYRRLPSCKGPFQLRSCCRYPSTQSPYTNIESFVQ